MNPEFYSENAIVQKQVAEDLVRRLIQHETSLDTSVLDIGCGTGFIAQNLLNNGFTNITQVDKSENVIKFCQKNLPSHVKSICADWSALPFKDNTFDVITSSMALQWANNQSDVLAEIKRVLKPNGLCVMAIPLAGSLRDVYNVFIDNNIPCPIILFYGASKYAIPSKQFSCTVKNYTEVETTILKFMQNLNKMGLRNSNSEEVLLKQWKKIANVRIIPRWTVGFMCV